ncbi:MAG: class I SAM-dependent methyltransferase [Pseudomonadota bacterium]
MSANTTHASFTGAIPEAYDRYLGPLLFEFSAADTARRVAAATNGPVKLLEVACGTGISTRHLAGALPAGSEIMATDLNQAMLDHAGRVNGDLPGVTYRQADALDLPFEGARFDGVVCQFGIMFFPDKAKGLAEMARVLKPGGVLLLTVWDSFAQNPAVAVVDRVIKSFFETDPPRFLEAPFAMHDRDAGRALIEGAGFAAPEVNLVSAAVASASHGDTARGFITGNPTINEVNERATVGADEIIASSIAELEAEFGPTPVKLPFQEIVYSAHKPL